jgi:hypothetical protein
MGLPEAHARLSVTRIQIASSHGGGQRAQRALHRVNLPLTRGRLTSMSTACGVGETLCPWAAGSRNLIIRIAPDVIAGRVLLRPVPDEDDDRHRATP